jgi:hypothetical protein
VRLGNGLATILLAGACSPPASPDPVIAAPERSVTAPRVDIADTPEPEPKPPVPFADLEILPERNLREVWAKLDAVEAELFRRADPVLRDAFANGFSEPVSLPSELGGGCGLGMDLLRDRERRTISATRTTEDGRERRVVLLRTDFPALYVWKDESVRLRELAEFFQRRQLTETRFPSTK